MTEKIRLGDYVKDPFTQFQGIVIGKTLWLYGCCRVIVASSSLHDGVPVTDQIFDELQVHLHKTDVQDGAWQGVFERLKDGPKRTVDFEVGIKLGSRVKDKITKFKGIVVAKTIWLYGNTRITVKPEKLYKEKPVDVETFDEPQVELIQTDVFTYDRVGTADLYSDDRPDPTVREIAKPRE